PLMTLEANGGIDAGVNIAFSPSVGEQVGDLVLDVPDAEKGVISGFGIGNTIDLQGSLYSTAIFTPGTMANPGTLTLSGGSAAPLSLAVSGDYSSDSFRATPGTNNTIVTLVPCFAAGTRIATSRGEVAVEQLTIGDEVLTPVDESRPIVWIGSRSIDCRRHPDPRKIWPVCIVAGAFGPDLPQRDLWLSPDHSVFVDEVLIPIKYLINDATIMQVSVDEVTYYHVELPRHDVLLAEGLPAESYLNGSDYGNFDNSDAPIALHPDFSTRAGDAFLVWEAYGCAPLVVTGPVVAAVRARLLQRAAKLAVRSARRPRKIQRRRVA
ncbi:MAG TPA: Hint domain-containing protein, partial [Acetobacteraceae bacterium]|nr:Hint domain-containing protein [Acetobacteraceae bacterium]